MKCLHCRGEIKQHWFYNGFKTEYYRPYGKYCSSICINARASLMGLYGKERDSFIRKSTIPIDIASRIYDSVMIDLA